MQIDTSAHVPEFQVSKGNFCLKLTVTWNQEENTFCVRTPAGLLYATQYTVHSMGELLNLVTVLTARKMLTSYSHKNYELAAGMKANNKDNSEDWPKLKHRLLHLVENDDEVNSITSSFETMFRTSYKHFIAKLEAAEAAAAQAAAAEVAAAQAAAAQAAEAVAAAHAAEAAAAAEAAEAAAAAQAAEAVAPPSLTSWISGAFGNVAKRLRRH